MFIQQFYGDLVEIHGIRVGCDGLGLLMWLVLCEPAKFV